MEHREWGTSGTSICLPIAALPFLPSMTTPVLFIISMVVIRNFQCSGVFNQVIELGVVPKCFPSESTRPAVFHYIRFNLVVCIIEFTCCGKMSQSCTELIDCFVRSLAGFAKNMSLVIFFRTKYSVDICSAVSKSFFSPYRRAWQILLLPLDRPGITIELVSLFFSLMAKATIHRLSSSPMLYWEKQYIFFKLMNLINT